MNLSTCILSKKRAAVLVLFFSLVSGIYSMGTGDPLIYVTTPSPTSRQIDIDWTGVKQTNKYRFGIYRARRSDQTIDFVREISPGDYITVDEGLEPPLTNYFYFPHHVDYGASLDPNDNFPRGKRIPQTEIDAQLITIPPELRTPLPVRGTVQAELPNPLILPSNIYPTAREVEQYQPPPIQGSSRLHEGIHIGLSFFSDKVESTPYLIPLDPGGRREIIERLNLNYTSHRTSGRALFYAAHTALEGLSALDRSGAMPANLESVSIVTFTGGVDTSSTDVTFPPLGDGVSFAGKQTGSYMAYMNQQIKGRRIGGRNVDAWAIGVQGREGASNTDFSRTLDSLSSSPRHAAYMTDINQVERQLNEIGNRLSLWTPLVKLSWTAPAYPIGTTVRLTFDGAQPDSARRFLEGRVTFSENNYTITGLRAQGLNLMLDRNILEGRRTDRGIEYTITLRDKFDEASLMQWYKQTDPSSTGNWHLNRDFQTRKLNDFTSSRKSAIIYLVLDCSSSLTEFQINNIRSAVERFINRLYNASSSGDAGALTSGISLSVPQGGGGRRQSLIGMSRLPRRHTPPPTSWWRLFRPSRRRPIRARRFISRLGLRR